MKLTLDTILLLLALSCFVVAALGIPLGRLNLVAAGLALFILSLLL